MAWKQALASIKKEFKEEPVKPVPEKPKPKPAGPARPMEDEDALFLAAMGQRAVVAPRKEPVHEARVDVPKAAPAPAMSEPVESFAASMADLKGIKAMPRKGDARALVAPSKEAAAPIPVPAGSVPEEVEPVPSLEAEAQPESVAAEPVAQEAAPHGPRLIHLAAGMAVEVDGFLDLRGHSVQDALERLRERVQDAICLGWRTLHVHLGPESELAQMLEAFLHSAAAHGVSRYAQAPIPMGGSQAWILYLVQS